MLKNSKNKSASILLLVAVIIASASVLFVTLWFMTNQYVKQVSSLEFWNLAENSVESWIEEWIIRYFENSEKKYEDYNSCTTWTCAEIRRKNILYSEIKKNIFFDLKNSSNPTNPDQKDISKKIFLQHKSFFWSNSKTEVWELEVNATRLKNKIEWKIFPFEKFEFRLTAEEREKHKLIWNNNFWHQSNIKQLKLVWNKLNWDTNSSQIKILQIRWPIWQPWNIETHKISFDNWWVYRFWDFWDKKEPKNSILNLPTDEEYSWNFSNPDNKFKKYEYIYILESWVEPIVFNIYWLNWTWSNAKSVLLPDRSVYFTAKSKIWWYSFNWKENFDLWWENSWRSFNKILKAKKEIYTNFDSNFDYARNFINF